jgi:hypothetical protein
MTQIRRFVESVVAGLAGRLIEATDVSLNERMRAVDAALRARFDSAPGAYCYSELVFDSYVIVNKAGKLWRMNYTVAADGTVMLDAGEPVQVRMQPVAVGEAVVREGMVFGPLADDDAATVTEGEAPKKPSGKKWGVLIIQEGLSKNRNNYGRKVLQEAAPMYEGARVYLDHQEGERRFGRSTKDVAGFLKDVQPVLMRQAGAAEATEAAAPVFGLAATMVVTKPSVREELLDAWDEGKPDLFGLSHDVMAESVTVMAAGGAFYDVTRIESVKSVDLVTNPAAGGRVLRLVASATVPQTLSEDEQMLTKLIEAIKTSGNQPLIAKLESLGANPTEVQIMAIYQEAVKLAPAAAPAAPAPATTTAPATEAVQPVSEAVTLEALIEVRRDGLQSYLEAQLAGCSLPDPVKDFVRGEQAARIDGARTLAALPTKESITGAIGRQVELYGRLAEAKVIVPAASQKGRIEVMEGRRDKVSKALDDFFGVKADGFTEGHDGTKVPKFRVVAAGQGVRSFKQLYVDITGDANVTGQKSEAVRLSESLDSTSFDQILGDSITRRMVAEYQQASQAMWRGTIADVVPVSDFRTQRRMRMGAYANLSSVSQGAPYPAMTSPTDEEATYAATKRGGTEEITIEMIANDDVGVIRRIPSKMARAAAQTLYEFVFDFLRTNAAVYDATALAAVGHGNNLVTTALSSANIVALRNRMKKQTDMSNGKRLGLSARYLWVPTDLEELAFQLTAATKAINDAGVVTTAEPSAPNFVNKIGIEARVVDYWADANDYWITASIDQTPMIEVGFLNGREDPELFVQDMPNQGSMFSNDKLTYKIRHIYGGAVLDYRGFAAGIVP